MYIHVHIYAYMQVLVFCVHLYVTLILISDKGPCSHFDYNVVKCTHKIPPPPLEGHVERPCPPPRCIHHLVSK